jgi:hypothetical protein
MPKYALTYAWCVILTGTAILICAAARWHSPDAAAFGVCLALALFASTQKLKLAGLTGTLSPGFVFLLIAVATLSWTETVIIAVISGLTQLLWRPARQPDALQFGFAVGTMAISGGLTYGVTWGLVSMNGGYARAVILGIAALVLLVTNSLIVATILCLLNEAPFHTIWRSVQSRVVPYYLAGGVLADVWIKARLTRPTGVAVLAAISVYLLTLCLRELDALARV